MATRLKIKQTAVPGKKPVASPSTDSAYIEQGELALNTADKKLWTNDGSAIVELTTNDIASILFPGLIKIGFTENGRDYPLELDSSNKAYVNVPWTDTDTLAGLTDTDTAGAVNDSILKYDSSTSKWEIAENTIDLLEDTDTTGINHNAILKYDIIAGKWVIGTNATAGATSSAILPVAYARLFTTYSGTGTGINWSAYNSSNGQIQFYFNTVQPDFNYSVVTDSEGYDNLQIQTINKTTTGFKIVSADASGSYVPPSTFPFSLIVYPSNPLQTITSDSYTGSGLISISGSGAISTTAETNVQSDWTATSGDAAILNKPTDFSTGTSGFVAGPSTADESAGRILDANNTWVDKPTNGTDGNGITGSSYNASDGKVTLTFDTTADFTTGDLRRPVGAIASGSNDIVSSGTLHAEFLGYATSSHGIHVPSSTTQGDVLTAGATAGALTWAAPSSSSVEISDDVPISPSAGDLWIDSASMSLNAYYADGTSSQWVGISGSSGGGSGGFNGVMDDHMIPTTNDTYDIGSAEYKIRDLYVSDNSLWIGDDHKVSIEGGKQRNKKRKKGKTPKKVYDALIGAGKPFATEADLKVKFKADIHAPAPANTVDPDHADFQPLTHQWLHFAIINGMAGAITPENIFDDTDDFELQNGIADVEGLQDVLDGKVDDSQVLTSVPSNALFTDTNTDTKWDGDPTGLNAAWGRTSLGLGTAATSAATDFETADADISKTDVAETRSAPINMADNVLQRPEIKDYSETKVAMGANDVDLSSGNVFTKTISSGTTLTFINPPASGKAGAFTLIVTLSGSPTIYWPSTVKWAGGTAPTLTSSGIDIFTFMTTDGGNIWYGFTAAQDLT